MTWIPDLPRLDFTLPDLNRPEIPHVVLSFVFDGDIVRIWYQPASRPRELLGLILKFKLVRWLDFPQYYGLFEIGQISFAINNTGHITGYLPQGIMVELPDQNEKDLHRALVA